MSWNIYLLFCYKIAIVYTIIFLKIIHLDSKPKIDDFFFLILYFSDLTPVFYPTYYLLLCFERKSCFSDVLKMYCVDLAAFLKNLNCLHTWSQDYRVADHNWVNIFWMKIFIAQYFYKVKNGLSNITSKSSSKNLSNENKHWCFCCLQDKTWIKMQILWNYWDSLTNFLKQ